MDDTQIGQSAGRALTSLSRRSALRRLGAGGVVAGTALGFQSRSAGAQFTISAAATEAAARRAISAINQALAGGDMSVLNAAFSPDYVNQTPRRSFASGQLFSPDLPGLKASLTELRAAVPDAVLLVADVVASPDTASVLGSFRGTLSAAVVNLPGGSDIALRVDGVAFGRFSGRQVIESWDYDDAAETYGTLVPAPEEQPVDEPAPDDGRGEARDVRDFQEVALEGVGTLVIEQGETESLSIEAEPRVLRRIETAVSNGRLTIRPDRSFETREPITYYLTVRQLSGIELSGAGQIQAGQLSADHLRLTGSGAGSMIVDNLTATSLEMMAAGNMQSQLAGAVDSLTVTLSDAARIAAPNLTSRVASISASGASQATINVSESLDARVSGAARVEYIGNPSLTQDVSAAGSLTNVG